MHTFTVATLLASSFAVSAQAGSIHARHQDFHAKRETSHYAQEASTNTSCGCYTYTTTMYGEWGLVPDATTSTSATTTSSLSSTTSSTSEYVTPVNYVASSNGSSSSSTTTSTSSSVWVAPTSYAPPSSSEASSSTTPSPSSVWVALTSYVLPSSSEASSSAATTTSSVWVVPTSYAPSSSSEASSSAWVAPTSYAPSSSSEALSSVATTASSVWVAPTSYASPSSSEASSSVAPSPSSGSSGSISPNGNQWAFCYTPYAADGTCKSASQVSSDVASIKAKGFTTIRLYATDCSGPQNVGTAAAENGLKLILGIYIDGSGIGGNTDEQITTLTQWGQGKWDMVEMVVAGNEAIFNGFASASQLAGFVSDVKSKFKEAGYSGPVGTTEPLGTFQENAATLCPAVDYAGANIHPFFNTDVSAEQAGGFVAKQIEDLAAACNNEKEAYNLESGWPSSGLPNGLAIPGTSDQKTAIEGIIAAAGAKSAIFSFVNDVWKAPGPFDVEQFWGCSDLFGDQ